MRTLQQIFVGLNTICGFIHITLLLLFRPLGYWMYPLFFVIFFVMGYFMKFESTLERYDGVLLYTGILFLINLGLFTIFGVVYINDPTDMMTIGTILPDLEITAAFNFHTLGNLLGEIRGVS